MSVHDQPPPKPNVLAAVWDLVLVDIRERDKLGEQRYRTRLQPFNGRDALTDLYQELLDAVVYTRQCIEEDRRINRHPPGAVDRCLDAVRWDDVDPAALSAARAELAALREKAAIVDSMTDGCWHWMQMAADLLAIAKEHPGGQLEHAIEEVKRKRRERDAMKAIAKAAAEKGGRK